MNQMFLVDESTLIQHKDTTTQRSPNIKLFHVPGVLVA